MRIGLVGEVVSLVVGVVDWMVAVALTVADWGSVLARAGWGNITVITVIKIIKVIPNAQI